MKQPAWCVRTKSPGWLPRFRLFGRQLSTSEHRQNYYQELTNRW